jgi:methyl-accepting chemotaxis protein
MEKVTQQNASTAEESASSAEEMNAQAEEMKGFVRRLAVLVGGKTMGSRNRSGMAGRAGNGRNRFLTALNL